MGGRLSRFWLRKRGFETNCPIISVAGGKSGAKTWLPEHEIGLPFPLSCGVGGFRGCAHFARAAIQVFSARFHAIFHYPGLFPSLLLYSTRLIFVQLLPPRSTPLCHQHRSLSHPYYSLPVRGACGNFNPGNRFLNGNYEKNGEYL